MSSFVKQSDVRQEAFDWGTIGWRLTPDKGSKRDTWVISGRSTSMPNCSHTYAASSGDSAMFFGASGSMAGGTMLTLPPMPAGT